METPAPGRMGGVHTTPRASTASNARRSRPSRGGRSLANELERDRLEQRVTRVRLVIGALRERADAREGAAPRPLRAAIEDFGRELAELERQLRRVRGGQLERR